LPIFALKTKNPYKTTVFPRFGLILFNLKKDKSSKFTKSKKAAKSFNLMALPLI